MTIDPELLPHIEQFPMLVLTGENLKQTRRQLNQMSLEAAAGIEGFDHVTVTDELIAGPSRDQTLRLRLYSLHDSTSPRPCLLWIHGGGYILGCPEMDELLLCRTAEEVGCLVVTVDYRLAPEHPYPAALDDCDAALGWILENAGELSVEQRSLALAGASAGGGLAAALALRAKCQRPGAVTFQCLIYPMLDHRNVAAAPGVGGGYRLWDLDNNRFAWDAYLHPNDPSQRPSPFASPATARQLDGLPPTYLCIGDQDLFYVESIDYVRRLRDGKVPVDLDIVPGAPHGFDMFPVRLAAEALERRFRALARHFSTFD